MPRSCSACSHPSAGEIAKAIARDEPFRTIASRFGLVAASLHRHAVRCLKVRRTKITPKANPLEKPLREPFDASNPQSLVAATARLVDDALDLLEYAKKADDRRTALVALREARDGLALLMRTAGMLTGEGNVIDQRSQTIQILGNVSEDDLRALVAAGRVALTATPP